MPGNIGSSINTGVNGLPNFPTGNVNVVSNPPILNIWNSDSVIRYQQSLGNIPRSNNIFSQIAGGTAMLVNPNVTATEVNKNLSLIDSLGSLSDIGKTLQDKTFWYKAIAIIVGIVMILIALQGFILSESNSVISSVTKGKK